MLTRIVRRIHVGDGEWPDHVHLDRGAGAGPRVVVHGGRGNPITARLCLLPMLIVERVAHADRERPCEYGNVLVSRVPVGRDRVACRHHETYRDQPLARGISIDDGELRSGGKDRRKRSPFDGGGAAENVMLGGGVRRGEAGDAEECEAGGGEQLAVHEIPPDVRVTRAHTTSNRGGWRTPRARDERRSSVAWRTCHPVARAPRILAVRCPGAAAGPHGAKSRRGEVLP